MESKADFIKRVERWDEMMSEKDRREVLRLASIGAKVEEAHPNRETDDATFVRELQQSWSIIRLAHGFHPHQSLAYANGHALTVGNVNRLMSIAEANKLHCVPIEKLTVIGTQKS